MPGKYWMRILMLFCISLLFFKQAAQAQDCNPMLDPNCADPVPLDGGLGLLLAAGLAYGLKKIKSGNLKE